MVNLYLPGNSKRNLEFTERFAKKLSKKYDWNVYARRWNHWFENENENINFEIEVDQTVKILKNFRKNFGITAKSVGSLVALESLLITGYTPKYLVLMGIPIQDTNSDLFDRIVESLMDQLTKKNAPELYFIVNKEDHISSASAIEQVIEMLREKLESEDKKQKIKLLIKEESGHSYEYLEDLVILLERYNQ